MKTKTGNPKATDEELRQHAALCHSLFFNNTSGVARFDSKLRLLEVNPALVAMTRSSRKRLLTLRLPDLIDAGDWKRAAASFEALRRGRPYENSLELKLRVRSGPCRYVHAAPTGFYHDDGSFWQGMIILTDITKRKLAEEELRQQAEFNKALLNKTSALLVVYDTKGVIQHISPAVEKLFGYSNEQLRGKNMWKLSVMDAEEVARSRKRVRALIEGKGNIMSTMRLRTASGDERVMEIISTVVPKLTGGVDCIIATGTDITERERLQHEVLRVSEADQIRIGHDLHDGVGQSLTGLTTLMESLEGELTGKHRILAARIRTLLQTTVKDVRRLSHGMSPIAIRNRGLREALLMLAETVRENFRTRCTCVIDERACLPDLESQTHLFRIAQEAVSNALRHGHASQLKIRLKRISDDHQSELSVRDNGSGIVRRGGKNDGIGLRVMQYRADTIGCDLKIKSVPGRGVTVSCRFGGLKKEKWGKILTIPPNSGKSPTS